MRAETWRSSICTDFFPSRSISPFLTRLFAPQKSTLPPGEGITDAKGTQTAYTFDNFGRYENITVDNGAGLTYNYSNGKLSQIQRKSNGASTLAYSFVYDDFGNTEEIKVGNKLLASYEYAAQNGLLLSQSYGNQDSVSFTYDNLGRAKTTTYSSGRVLSYIYTGDGQLYSVHDSATGYTYIYTYDSLGRLIASRVEDSSSQVLMRTKLWYNASNQITKQTWTVGDTTYQETYAYNTGDATLSSYQNALGQTVSLGYDFLRRLSTVTAGNIYTQTYTYRDIDDSKTTTQVSGLAYSGFTVAPSYGYTYDVLGNILTYTENGTAYAYTYDDLNQLLTATGGGKAWAYTYDLGGNILTATDGTTSHTYTYGDANWADLLTAFDGETITYDASGNPLSYYNGSRYTFAWAEGRRLTSAAVNGKTYTYAYDSDGLRLSKTVDGATHNYFYASGKLLRETYDNVTLDFLYDNHGYPYALVYTAGETAATYYYITNLQGDVLGLIDTNGATVASYQYDPYGKLLSVSGSLADSIGQINPLRYRGYYYDSETELYYLQSRYYDTTTCRFINADIYVSTGQGLLGHNMFAYCLNNPVCRVEVLGATSEDIFDEDGNPFTDDDKRVDGGNMGDLGGKGSGKAGGSSGGKTPPTSPSPPAPNGGNSIDGNNACFIAGTAVLTAAGNKNIEQIEAGDLVWAWDKETGDVALKEVVETYVNETTELVHVFVNGEEIITTPSHPFYSPVKGWTDAVHLRAGDILVLVNGEYVVVEKVQHEILETPITVYNFQVEDHHTYFVSSQGVLVHNRCYGSYEITFESGKNYVGKGDEARMNRSANEHSKRFNDPVVSKKWEYAPDERTAYVQEYFKMMKRGINNPNTYNMIWSPGRSIFMEQWR